MLGKLSMLALLAAAPFVADAQQTYTCRRLGESDRYADSQLRGINNRGETTGAGHTLPFGWSPAALMWKKNGHRPIQLGPRDRYSEGHGINDAGHVVGWQENPANSCCRGFAMLWADGVKTKLPAIGGLKDGGYARAINNVGQIVGTSATGAMGEPWHATLWDHGSVVDLGALAEGQPSYGNGINEAGIVVGSSDLKPGVRHAVRWDADGIVDLGVLEGGQRASASAVNRRQVIVGESEFEGGQPYDFRPVAWVRDKIRPLAVLPGNTEGTARDINDDNIIVGSSGEPAGALRATIWFGVASAPADLNALIGNDGCRDAEGVLWTLTYAVGINNKGVIAVSGRRTADNGDRFWANFVVSPTAP